MQPVRALPVHWSLVRVDALAQALEAAYGLSQVRCQLIKATINDTYHVWASEGRFVLRISRAHERSVHELTAELDAMTALALEEVQVAAIVPLRTGERLLPIHAPKGVRYAVLFTFMEGSQLSKTPETDDVRRYGRTVAALHESWDEKVLTVTRPRLDMTRLIDVPLAALAVVLTHPEQMDYLQKVAEGIPALHVNEWGSAYLTERMVAIQLEIIQRNLLKMR